jgi:hypothetical protein
MKILLSERQIESLVEALGVPDNIEVVATKLYLEAKKSFNRILKYKDYDDFLNNPKLVQVNGKMVRYKKFGGVIRLEKPLSFGGRKQYTFDEFVFDIHLTVDNTVNEPTLQAFVTSGEIEPVKSVLFKPGTNKRYDNPPTVSRHIDKGVNIGVRITINKNHKLSQIYDLLFNVGSRNEIISNFAHELKHIYDGKVEPNIKSYEHSLYGIIQMLPEVTQIDEIKIVFRAMYVLSNIENLVRPSELYTMATRRNLNKKQFEDYLRKDTVFYGVIRFVNRFSAEDFYKKLLLAIQSKHPKNSTQYFITLTMINLDLSQFLSQALSSTSKDYGIEEKSLNKLRHKLGIVRKETKDLWSSKNTGLSVGTNNQDETTRKWELDTSTKRTLQFYEDYMKIQSKKLLRQLGRVTSLLPN